MIGAGNLAVHLSKAFQDAGFNITQVYSRSETSAKALAGILQTQFTTSIDALRTDALLYVLSVSDDVIACLVGQLPLTDQLVIHTAGSVPMDTLSGKLQNYGVLYPLQTFSKSRPIDFTGIPVFLEANTSENLQKITEIAKNISEKVYQATTEQRLYLHLSAVFGCNFVNYLYGISSQILQQAGFDFDVLSPLIIETAAKAIASGNPRQVQTGPAIRNDRKVMQKHLDILADHPDWQNIYAQLSEYIGKNNIGEHGCL